MDRWVGFAVQTFAVLNAVTISFFVFLAAFTAVGIYASTRKVDTPEDYLLASRGVSPYLVALSAVSTQNSGFMFIGLTGSAYSLGLQEALWLSIGWVVGDSISWLFVHRRMRAKSEQDGSTTVPQLLAQGSRPIAIVASLITLAFLGLYAAAQLNAGAKALETYSISPDVTVVLGALMVGAYCISGGIRASIWTDAVQSIVMFVSMGVLVTVALVEVGGFGELWRRLAAEDAALTTWFGDSRFGFAMFFVGWIAAGFGVVGQPHVMVRYMTIADEEGLSTARWVYLSWFALFSAACVLVGLAARVIVPPSLVSDAEMAFPLVADNLLPGVMVGLMLAGLFAATISTADSQVLCCSAAVSQDLIPSLKSSYRAVKIATLCVTAIALVIALLVTHVPSFNSVFQQVVFAWSALAGSLGPLMVVRVLGRRVDTGLGLAMIAGGFLAVIVWRFVLRFHGDIYDALPGMLAGALVYLIGAPLQRPRAA